MAREYARIKLTIWNDPDFKALSTDAQWLYFTMLTNATINSCGVLEWREPKLANFSSDMTIQRLRRAAWELGQAGLAAVDPETEEALVRSFVRHDGVLQSPNMSRALVREHGGIASLKIMAIVSREVRRGLSEHPEWKGAEAAEPVRKQFPNTDSNPSNMVPEWFQNGSETVPTEIPLKQGNPSNLVPEQFDPSLIPYPSLKRESTRKRAHPLPDDWMPNAKHIEKAMAKGIDIHTLAERFRDWAIAGGKKFVDWDAAFNGWINREDPRPTHQHSPKSPWDM